MAYMETMLEPYSSANSGANIDSAVTEVKRTGNRVAARLSGAGAPTSATIGAVGDFYTDTSSDGGLYRCTAASGGAYTWEEVGSGAFVPYNVNLLDNADWICGLVNQRGGTEYTLTDAYGIDRWLTTGGITLHNPTASAAGYITMASDCMMKQRMEILPPALIGKTFTAAIDVGGTMYSGTLDEFPDSGEETVFSAGGVTVKVGFDGDPDGIGAEWTLCGITDVSACPYIKITASAAVNVRRVWLERGSVCHMETTPPRNYAENAAVCSRYLQTVNSALLGVAYTSSNGQKTYLSIPLASPLRAAPQFIYTPDANSKLRCYIDGNTYDGDFYTIEYYSSNYNAAIFTYSMTTAGTPAKATIAPFILSPGSSPVLLSAEL